MPAILHDYVFVKWLIDFTMKHKVNIIVIYKSR